MKVHSMKTRKQRLEVIAALFLAGSLAVAMRIWGGGLT